MRGDDLFRGIALMGGALLLYGVNLCYARLGQQLDLTANRSFTPNVYANLNAPLVIGLIALAAAAMIHVARGVRR